MRRSQTSSPFSLSPPEPPSPQGERQGLEPPPNHKNAIPSHALAHDALTDWVTLVIAAVSLILLLVTELDTLWIILGAAVVSLSAQSLELKVP